jgi:hypothetical protein
VGSDLEGWLRDYITYFKDAEGRCHGAVSAWGVRSSGACY